MTTHIFITASIEERVKRRYKQFNGKYSKKEIKQTIEKRDRMHEEAGYNQKFDKTVVVDVTDCKTARESAEKVLNNIELKI